MKKYVINYISSYESHYTVCRGNPYIEGGLRNVDECTIKRHPSCEVIEAESAGEAVEKFKEIHDELVENPKIRHCGYEIISVIA